METQIETSLPASEVTNRQPRSTAVSRALKALDRDGLPKEQEPHLFVCPLRHTWDLEEVYRITHDAYVERGYCASRPDGRLVHYPHLDGIPETTVLVAVLDGAVVGTNSLTLDGPRGLHVDEDFKAECDAIRAEGRRVAGSWRIATRAALRSETRVVMALIQATVDLLRDKGVETGVFTFNPRHERFYQRLLNMQTVARHEGSVHGLQNAPAVFMRTTVADLPERWSGRQLRVNA